MKYSSATFHSTNFLKHTDKINDCPVPKKNLLLKRSQNTDTKQQWYIAFFKNKNQGVKKLRLSNKI